MKAVETWDQWQADVIYDAIDVWANTAGPAITVVRAEAAEFAKQLMHARQQGMDNGRSG